MSPVSGLCHCQLWGVTECVDELKAHQLSCSPASKGAFGMAQTKTKSLSRVTESCFDSLMNKLCLCLVKI